MVDMHRHLPEEHEPPIPPEWIVWFASSSTHEWDRMSRLGNNPLHRHGYGLLPSAIQTDGGSIDDMAESLEQMLVKDPLGYVGEIGLDTRFESAVPLAFQFSLATSLLQVAQRMGRPVVIHHIGPAPLLEQLIGEGTATVPIIIHGYVKSIERARRLTEMGATVSFGPKVWMQETKLARNLAAWDMPCLLETDYPHVPEYDGKRLGYTDTLNTHLQRMAQVMDRDERLLEEQLDGQAALFTDW